MSIDPLRLDFFPNIPLPLGDKDRMLKREDLIPSGAVGFGDDGRIDVRIVGGGKMV